MRGDINLILFANNIKRSYLRSDFTRFSHPRAPRGLKFHLNVQSKKNEIKYARHANDKDARHADPPDILHLIVVIYGTWRCFTNFSFFNHFFNLPEAVLVLTSNLTRLKW